jgi:cytochrome c oxidase cbb3-type subunit 3
MSRILASLIFASAWLLAGPLAAAPDGKALYDQHCAVCHQSHGRGGIGLPLSQGKLENVSDDYLRKTIRLGRPGRIMPAFEELSDAQLDALVGYMRSWCDKPGLSFDPTPIAGDLQRGQALYEANCAKCHGNDGSGEGAGTGVTLSRERAFLVMPAAINNPGFLSAAPDAMIKHTIVTGRKDSDMPSFADRLSDAEIDDVVAYVRSFADAADQAQAAAEGPPAHVVESPYDFQTTLDNVHQALVGANFRLFPDRFLEEGLTDEFSHNPKQVSIRFCNFKQLYNMLNVEPRLGVVLPCTITVTEQADGQVLLVAPNMTAISHWFNNAELEELGQKMDAAIVGILEEVTL